MCTTTWGKSLMGLRGQFEYGFFFSPEIKWDSKRFNEEIKE